MPNISQPVIVSLTDDPARRVTVAVKRLGESENFRRAQAARDNMIEPDTRAYLDYLWRRWDDNMPGAIDRESLRLLIELSACNAGYRASMRDRTAAREGSPPATDLRPVGPTDGEQTTLFQEAPRADVSH